MITKGNDLEETCKNVPSTRKSMIMFSRVHLSSICYKLHVMLSCDAFMVIIMTYYCTIIFIYFLLLFVMIAHFTSNYAKLISNVM